MLLLLSTCPYVIKRSLFSVNEFKYILTTQYNHITKHLYLLLFAIQRHLWQYFMQIVA
jgi:hypothetical protein